MKYLSAAILVFLCHTVFAIPPGQWECTAYDAHEKSYEALGMSMLDAMRAANDLCQSKSQQKRCKTAQSFCEQGPLSLTDDRCIVADGMGRSWNATGRDACKTALSLCMQWQWLHSRMTQCSVKHR